MNQIKQIEMENVSSMIGLDNANRMIETGWILLMVYKNGDVLLGANKEVAEGYEEFRNKRD